MIAQPWPSRDLREGDDPEDVTTPRRVEGSDATYTRIDIRDAHGVIDWFPGDHPPMPDIIRRGPESLLSVRGWGCGSCHLPNGKGRPENAPPAGQPVEYTIRQLQDMATGQRFQRRPSKTELADDDLPRSGHERSGECANRPSTSRRWRGRPGYA